MIRIFVDLTSLKNPFIFKDIFFSMPGHRPIFVTLVTDFYVGLRDILYKATIEPKAPEVRKEKEAKKGTKKTTEKKPWEANGLK